MDATSKPIMAVDAGFVATGWAVVTNEWVAVGCIRTETNTRKGAVRVADDDAERCRLMARELAATIKRYDVRGVVAELPSGGAQGARAIACMARAAAVLAATVELLGLPAEWCTPGDVKKITGNRGASKAEVEEVVRRRWPTLILPKIAAEREHVVDALGAYIACENGNLVRMLRD